MAREREGGVITDVNTQPSLPSRPISKLHSSGGALLIHSSSAVAASPLGEQDIQRGTKRYVNLAKQDPGKARQSS